MGERMRDLGRAAMVAASLNSGIASEALANDKEQATQERIQDLHGYEVSDAATQDMLRKLDSGEYKWMPDSTPAEVFLVGDDASVLSVARSQDLYIEQNAGRVVTSRDLSQGDSIDWNGIVVDSKGKVVCETESVQISLDGKALVVTIVNSDKTIQIARFEEGKVQSIQTLEQKKQ